MGLGGLTPGMKQVHKEIALVSFHVFFAVIEGDMPFAQIGHDLEGAIAAFFAHFAHCRLFGRLARLDMAFGQPDLSDILTAAQDKTFEQQDATSVIQYDAARGSIDDGLALFRHL